MEPLESQISSVLIKRILAGGHSRGMINVEKTVAAQTIHERMKPMLREYLMYFHSIALRNRTAAYERGCITVPESRSRHDYSWKRSHIAITCRIDWLTDRFQQRLHRCRSSRRSRGEHNSTIYQAVQNLPRPLAYPAFAIEKRTVEIRHIKCPLILTSSEGYIAVSHILKILVYKCSYFPRQTNRYGGRVNT